MLLNQVTLSKLLLSLKFKSSNRKTEANSSLWLDSEVTVVLPEIYDFDFDSSTV